MRACVCERVCVQVTCTQVDRDVNAGHAKKYARDTREHIAPGVLDHANMQKKEVSTSHSVLDNAKKYARDAREHIAPGVLDHAKKYARDAREHIAPEVLEQ